MTTNKNNCAVEIAHARAPKEEEPLNWTSEAPFCKHFADHEALIYLSHELAIAEDAKRTEKANR